MPVKLNSTGGGSVTVTVPSTASTFTLTLPASTGTALTDAAAVTVAQGGTGLATLTANNVLLGNGTGTPQFVAPGTTGNVLTSNGTTWSSSAPVVSFSSSTAWASVSRTSGTTYTNSLSYPIMFLVTGGLNGTLTMVVNGVTLMSLSAAYSNYEYCSPIIPSGATYSYTSSVTATGLFILS